MSYQGLLSQSCTIQTKTEDMTTLGNGQISETWADTYEDVSCRIINLSGTLMEQIRGYDKRATHMMFCLESQIIARGDKVVDSDSKEYLISFINPVEGKSGIHHKEIIMREYETA